MITNSLRGSQIGNVVLGRPSKALRVKLGEAFEVEEASAMMVSGALFWLGHQGRLVIRQRGAIEGRRGLRGRRGRGSSEAKYAANNHITIKHVVRPC